MIEEEFRRIDKVVDKALGLISRGKLKGAARLSAGLKSTWAVLESERAMAIIDSAIAISQGDRKGAKKRCLQRMSYLWDFSDTLHVIRLCHPIANTSCSFYNIQLQGGCPSAGMVGEDLYSDFLVLAKDETAATNFIKEIGCISDGIPTVFNVQSTAPYTSYTQLFAPEVSASYTFRCGVYRCSPFSKNESPPSFLPPQSETPRKVSRNEEMH